MWTCILSLWTSHKDVIFCTLTVAKKSLRITSPKNVWKMQVECEPKQSNLEWRINDSPEEIRSVYFFKESRVNASQTKRQMSTTRPCLLVAGNTGPVH